MRLDGHLESSRQILLGNIPGSLLAKFLATPLNAFQAHTCGLVTLAGLETNNNLQVLNVSGEVIPGLYAAGNCLGERYGNSYATPFAGNSIGMAMTHGRVAGKIITGQEVL